MSLIMLKRGGRATPVGLLPALLSLHLLMFGLMREGWAQTQSLANPTDLRHPWVSGVNPAVIPFQNSQLALGIKVLHSGFLEDQLLGLRENGFTISFPFLLPYQVGLGFDLRQFYASMYSEISASALVSKEIYHRLAIGLKLGVEQRALDRSKFNLVDPNDPLLQTGALDQYKLNTGAGLYWSPGKFTAGIGVDHLNRANVARQSKFLLPRDISGAVSYRFGQLVPSVILHDDGTKWNVGFMITAIQPKLGALRLGYENSFPVKLEAELNLSKNSKLNYGYDFATEGTRVASYGSQQLTYCRILGREPEIGTPIIFSSTEALKVLVEIVSRSTPFNLTPEVLASIGDLTPDYLAPMAVFENGVVVITAGKLSENESEAATKIRYRELGIEVERILRENPNSKIVLRAQDESRPDAKALERYLTEHLGLTFDETIPDHSYSAERLALENFKPGHRTVVREKPKLSADRVTFDLEVPGNTRRTQKWQFAIFGPDKRVVRSFVGKGNLPHTLEWDWRDGKGKLVSPGAYHCRLAVRTKRGKVKTSLPIRLNVFWIKRNVMLKFYEMPKPSISERTSDNSYRSNLDTKASNKKTAVRR